MRSLFSFFSSSASEEAKATNAPPPSSTLSPAAAAAKRAAAAMVTRQDEVISFESKELFAAVKEARLEDALRLLHTDNCDINVLNGNGDTVLEMAAEFGNVDLTKILIEDFHMEAGVSEHHNWSSPLHKAASAGHLSIIRLLCGEYHVDPNGEINSGKSPLHFAAENGQIESMSCLIKEFGANVDAKDNDGRTPLYMAVCMHQIDAVRALALQHNADAEAKNKSLWTPLHEAAYYGYADICDLLANELKVSCLSAANNEGYSPLHMTVEWESVEALRVLLQARANPDATNNKEQTILHMCTARNQPKMIEELIADCRINPNIPEASTLSTALHYTIGTGKLELMKMIVEGLGADIHAKNNVGHTALDLAKQNSVDDQIVYLNGIVSGEFDFVMTKNAAKIQ